jgi:hypothetical protein
LPADEEGHRSHSREKEEVRYVVRQDIGGSKEKDQSTDDRQRAEPGHSKQESRYQMGLDPPGVLAAWAVFADAGRGGPIVCGHGRRKDFFGQPALGTATPTMSELGL